MKTMMILMALALQLGAAETNRDPSVVTFTNLVGQVFKEVKITKATEDGLYWVGGSGQGGFVRRSEILPGEWKDGWDWMRWKELMWKVTANRDSGTYSVVLVATNETHDFSVILCRMKFRQTTNSAASVTGSVFWGAEMTFKGISCNGKDLKMSKYPPSFPEVEGLVRKKDGEFYLDEDGWQKMTGTTNIFVTFSNGEQSETVRVMNALMVKKMEDSIRGDKAIITAGIGKVEPVKPAARPTATKATAKGKLVETALMIEGKPAVVGELLVTSLTAKRTEVEYGYQTWAWKMEVRNPGEYYSDENMEVQFLDEDGYMIAKEYLSKLRIAPGKTAVFTGDRMMKAARAVRGLKACEPK
jgi:hypothetical protein